MFNEEVPAAGTVSEPPGRIRGMVRPQTQPAQWELAADVACCVAMDQGSFGEAGGLLPWRERKGSRPFALSAAVSRSFVLVPPRSVMLLERR